MVNDEKIIEMLGQINTKIDDLGSSVNARIDDLDKSVNASIDDLNDRLDSIIEDIEELKENSEITRFATNKLLDWAERVEQSASSTISIPPLSIVE